jgi:hypothetical protein
MVGVTSEASRLLIRDLTSAGRRCLAAISGRATVTCSLASVIVLLVTNSLGLAQLTISNPKHLDLPEQRVRVLLIEACRVVANEFHARNSSDVEYSLILVLGEKDEGWGIDNEDRITLYLREWNETKFVEAATRLAIQSLANHERVQRLAKEILRRSDRILPLSQHNFRDPRFLRPGHTPSPEGNCISAVRDEPCPTTNIGPDRQRGPRSARVDPETR